MWGRSAITPIRFPLLVWVNGYVNGQGVVDHLVAGEIDPVAGIPATVYRGSVVEMTAAFPGKLRDRELIPEATSFTYWVDECGTLLRADVVIELGGEEREIAKDLELPTTYRYQYLVFDVGADIDIEPPVDGVLPDIPAPPDRDLEAPADP